MSKTVRDKQDGTLTVVNGIIATLPPPIEKRVEKLEDDIETIRVDVTSLKSTAVK